MKKRLSMLLCFIFAFTMTVFNLGVNTKAQVGSKKNVIIYFPNWGIYGAPHQNFTVGMIPWDKVTVINHSFFSIDSNFKLTSIDTFADFEKGLPHSEGWGKLQGHFGEYKYYKTQYPNVKVLVSIGGWTRGENFHAMAKTPANRATFINSLISFLKQYPFIDGFDLDWEYPGIDRAKDPKDQFDRGCPGGPEDKENFTALLKEIREAYNKNNMTNKMLTIAAPAGYDKVELQEPDKYIQYLDFLSIMTYDYHGAWENGTNHHSPLKANPNDPSGTSPTNIKEKYNVMESVKLYIEKYKVPASKINIGTPLYSRGWIGVDPTKGENGMFSTATGAYKGSWDNPQCPGGQEAWFKLKAMENKNGWIKYRDKVNGSPWLYNKEAKTVLTYEDEESLDLKLDYINNLGLGGIIVWDVSGDDINGFPMITKMFNKLIGKLDDLVELKAPEMYVDNNPNNGDYNIKLVSPKKSTATSLKLYEDGRVIKEVALTANSSRNYEETVAFTSKAPKDYEYKLEVKDNNGATLSSEVKVSVEKTPVVNVDVKFTVTSDWGTGANFSIVITNNSDKDITNWTLEFDCAKKIQSFWDVTMTANNNHYKVVPKAWNGTIKKGGSITLGGACEGNMGSTNITNVKFNSN